MTLETSIAQAISKDFDILEAMPDIYAIPIDQLEPYVEEYIHRVHDTLRTILHQKGDAYLRSKDAAGLCALCLDNGISLPPRMLLKICQTIIALQVIDTRCVIETPNGYVLYFVKMTVSQ